MGLDQYAYVAAKSGQNDAFWAGAELDSTTGEFVNVNVNRPMEIAYWRKHPNLQGYMANLYRIKSGNIESTFNGQELELTWEDLDELERVIQAGELPETEGFFFGNNSDADYYNEDLEFIKNAKAEIFLGLKVFYNSSW